MGILDRLFGHEETPKQREQAPTPPPQQANPGNAASAQPVSDEQAVARYRYMLRTAPPETIEQAHEEAFAQLTPEQRRQVLQQLTSVAPPAERAALSAADDPQALARAATRVEVRQPGTLERIFGSSGPVGGGGGLGMGTVIGGSLLSSLAGAFIGSAIADHFFRGPMGAGFFGGGSGFGGFGGYGGAPVINETNIYNEGSPEHEHHDRSEANNFTGSDSDSDSDSSDSDRDSDTSTDDTGASDDVEYAGDSDTDSGSDFDSGSDDDGSIDV